MIYIVMLIKDNTIIKALGFRKKLVAKRYFKQVQETQSQDYQLCSLLEWDDYFDEKEQSIEMTILENKIKEQT